MYYLKIIFRNLRRNGIYSVVNITGLAFSLAAVIIITLWINNELNFNRWYNNSDKIYITGCPIGGYYTSLRSSEPLLKTLQTAFPEVKRVAHFLNDDKLFLYTWDDDMNGYNDLGAYADSALFEMMDVKLLRGTAQSVFQSPFSIVISENLAEKIFGKEDPVGKTLRANNFKEPFQVTGVFKEQPQNSSFRFQWLIPFTAYAKHNADQGWNPENDWHTTYFTCCVELHPKVDIITLNDKMKEIVSNRSGTIRDAFLYPITQLHLYGEFVDGKPVAGKRVREIRELSIIAFIILLIACINFMNLTTARAEKRMMEMGVRKTFGAKRRHLIWQLLCESAMLIILSLGLALMIVMFVLPMFNQLWNTDLTLYLWNGRQLCGLLLIAIICTVLSGLYPAFYISAFKPNDIMKKLKNRTSNSTVWIRRGLVMFQFTVSFILISLTIAIVLQTHHGQYRSLGYEKKYLLRVGAVNDIAQSVISHELGKSALVNGTAFTSDPLVNIGSLSTGFQWQGISANLNPAVHRSYVSTGYIETIGLKLLGGRNFYENNETDKFSVIINKTLADMMGDEGKINGELWQGERDEYSLVYTIIGIIDDYICDDLYKAKSEPLMLHKDDRGSEYFLYVRFNPQADVVDVLKMVQRTLSQFPTNRAPEYVFIDDLINRMFDGLKQEAMLAALFSLLSILISCLGLFGLVTYIAESKTKEIGIRKILGASTAKLVGMLIKEFLILVTVSMLVAFPLAYYWIYKMLQDYAYRISIGWWIFALAGIITILLTLITVGWQAMKAATANPVKAIKTE